MKYLTQNERKLIVAIYATVGAVLVWAIMMCLGCTYVDVRTDEVKIQLTGK